MTTGEKLDVLKSLLQNDLTIPTDEMLLVYLKLSQQEILSWRYGYLKNIPETVPVEFETTQIYAVLAGLSNSGSEGESSHSENGIVRQFKRDSMLAYIRANVRPICKVV